MSTSSRFWPALHAEMVAQSVGGIVRRRPARASTGVDHDELFGAAEAKAAIAADGAVRGSGHLRAMARRSAARLAWMNAVTAGVRCPECGNPTRPIPGTPGWAECPNCGESGPVHGARDCALEELAVARAANHQLRGALAHWRSGALSARSIVPRRSDGVAAWLRRGRDQYPPDSNHYLAMDVLLVDYLLHADTGTPLDLPVGDCTDHSEEIR